MHNEGDKLLGFDGLDWPVAKDHDFLVGLGSLHGTRVNELVIEGVECVEEVEFLYDEKESVYLFAGEAFGNNDGGGARVLGKLDVLKGGALEWVVLDGVDLVDHGISCSAKIDGV